MSRFDDLKAKFTAVAANAHQDVVNYVSALESKVSTNNLTWYAVGVAVALVVILVIWHKLKS